MSEALPGELPPEANGLGAFQREYRIDTASNRGLLLSCLFMSALGGALGVHQWFLGNPGDKATVLVLDGILTLFFLLLTVAIWFPTGSRVLVFTDGFVSFWVRRVFVCRWDEIDTVTETITNVYLHGVFTHTEHHLRVKRRDGKQLAIDANLKGIQELCNTVQSEALTRLYPIAVQALKNGCRVGFGPLRLSSEGIDNGTEVLWWGEIERVELDAGILTVRAWGMKRDWFSRPLGEIPNARILLALLEPFSSAEQP